MTRALTSDFCGSMMTAIVLMRFVVVVTPVVVIVAVMRPGRKRINQCLPGFRACCSFGIRQKASIKLASEGVGIEIDSHEG